VSVSIVTIGAKFINAYRYCATDFKNRTSICFCCGIWRYELLLWRQHSYKIV